jgi:glyoxylase-like metal-dependent hydrolase (beta-lactamase superfamily II)
MGGRAEKNATMSENELSIDVYVTPMRPFVSGPAPAPGIEPVWSPMSSALIAGPRNAVLVDALLTFDQADALADWVEAHEKNLTAILITHGHSDHWLGLARLLERFPDARGLAPAKVLERARFEGTDARMQQYWHGRFPGEIPAEPVLPDLYDADSFELDSHELKIIDIGQGDIDHTSIVHAPSIGAVVCGDVVYNQVHMMTAETDAVSRAAWVASLDAIAALDPTTVVAGHKRVGAPDTPDRIAQSRQYIEDFTRIVDEQEKAEDIVAEMMRLHGERDNPWVLWYCAQQAVGKR